MLDEFFPGTGPIKYLKKSFFNTLNNKEYEKGANSEKGIIGVSGYIQFEP